MKNVLLTITESRCRDGLFHAGEQFVVDNRCPPLCHELWHTVYPMVFALQNGADLDHGNERARCFDARCPDGGRVSLHGEVLEEKA